MARSMAEPAGGGASKWDLMSSALIDFLSNPANAEVGVGMGFFPENVQPTCTPGQPDCLCIPVINICFANAGGSCTAADYAAPSVPLALPPSPASAITSIQSRELAGGTRRSCMRRKSNGVPATGAISPVGTRDSLTGR